jgi:hypothetical protein
MASAGKNPAGGSAGSQQKASTVQVPTCGESGAPYDRAMTWAPNSQTAMPALLPAGQHWGRGTSSIAPYLREALATRPLNPVFTPVDFASVVWPPRRARGNPRQLP